MNLLNIVKSYLPADLIEETAKTTGTSEASISSIIEAAIPVTLGGLINRATSESNSIFVATQGAANAGLLGNLNQFLNNEATPDAGYNIWSILQNMFGEQLSPIISAIAGFAGTTPSIAKSVFGMTAAASLGAVGSYVKEQNLDAVQLSTLLASQKSHITSWIPTSLDLSKWKGLLGIGPILSNVNNPAPAAIPEPLEAPQEPQRNNGWVLPIIILVVLAGLIWWLMRSCNDDEIIEAQIVSDTALMASNDSNLAAKDPNSLGGQIDSMGNWVAEWGEEKSFQLEDGSVLTVGENSTEYQLYRFLADEKKVIDTIDKTKNWISFDRVYFETGKATLTEKSVDQIKNIGQILKNYPNAVIKIGGYTDNTGDPAVNQRVSGERAKIVAKELKKYGAADNQIEEAVGYGPEHPIATNNSEEGRAQNRRVDLKVANK
jgi:OOP family OmpA-OmpF porin